eukprot:TRINITY_DN14865_c0_g1_i1.p1 TRINITY_DN14865_c0_g1~~TRINITY_DN14865_c0_g1_i1.p1  ORF type:complete len:203 (+),score=68.81 TRINITY_DN14865_c0_g1_i1:189-797(+)
MSSNDHDQQVLETEERIAEHKRAIKASLEQASRLSGDTVEVANDTNRELRKQGDQLDHIDKTLDHTDEGLTLADSLVKSIDSFWYAINPFKRKPKASKGVPLAPKDSRTEGATASSSAVASRQADRQAQVAKKQDTKVYGLDEDEAAMLNNVANNLQILKQQSLSQSDELDRQNNMLEKMNPKAEALSSRMQQTTRKINSIT